LQTKNNDDNFFVNDLRKKDYILVMACILRFCLFLYYWWPKFSWRYMIGKLLLIVSFFLL